MISFKPFWNVQKREKLHFGLSETFRSAKNFILAFLKCSEAWKTPFWPFWNVQKHEKLHFGLSETFRSVKNFILAFLKRSEAWKTSFWPFWNVQKYEKLHFGLSETFSSVKNFFLAFLQCAAAWKINFWPFCSVQKRVFMFRRPTTACFYFQLLVDRRRIYFMNFLLYLSYLHPMDCCQTPLRQRKEHA